MSGFNDGIFGSSSGKNGHHSRPKTSSPLLNPVPNDVNSKSDTEPSQDACQIGTKLVSQNRTRRDIIHTRRHRHSDVVQTRRDVVRNPEIRRLMQNMVGSIESVIENLRGIVGDLRLLMEQIDDVTNKIDERCSGGGPLKRSADQNTAPGNEKTCKIVTSHGSSASVAMTTTTLSPSTLTTVTTASPGSLVNGWNPGSRLEDWPYVVSPPTVASVRSKKCVKSKFAKEVRPYRSGTAVSNDVELSPRETGCSSPSYLQLDAAVRCLEELSDTSQSCERSGGVSDRSLNASSCHSLQSGDETTETACYQRADLREWKAKTECRTDSLASLTPQMDWNYLGLSSEAHHRPSRSKLSTLAREYSGKYLHDWTLSDVSKTTDQSIPTSKTTEKQTSKRTHSENSSVKSSDDEYVNCKISYSDRQQVVRKRNLRNMYISPIVDRKYHSDTKVIDDKFHWTPECESSVQPTSEPCDSIEDANRSVYEQIMETKLELLADEECGSSDFSETNADAGSDVMERSMTSCDAESVHYDPSVNTWKSYALTHIDSDEVVSDCASDINDNFMAFTNPGFDDIKPYLEDVNFPSIY